MKFLTFVFSVLVSAGHVGAQQIFKSSPADAAPILKDAEKMPSAAVFLGTSGNFDQAVIEPVNNILYAVVRDEKRGKISANGHLVAIDLSNYRQLWQVFFSDKEANLYLHNGLPVMIFSDYSEAFSPADGRRKWRRIMQVRQLVPQLGLAIAGGRERGEGFLAAFDLSTGSIKWRYQSRALRDFGNVFTSGDTLITCVSSSLHQIDLRSGEGFSAPLNHRDPEFDGSSDFMLRSVIGHNFGLAGVLMYSALTLSQSGTTIGSDLRNSMVYNGTTYDATAQTIAAFQPPEGLVWEYAVPYTVVGIPRIFESGGALYGVYPGVFNSATVNIDGAAIVVKLDPATGEELAIAWLNYVKQQYIVDFMVRDTALLVAMNNKMVLLDTDNLEPISSKLFGDARMGAGLDRIVRPPYFTFSENRINNESEKEGGKLYIQNNAGMKIEFSDSFEPVAVVRKSHFFRFAGQTGSYSAYTNSVRTVITGSDGMLLPFEFTSNAQMSDAHVWDWNGKALAVIPVAGIQ